jgi:hypothetical protein
MVEIEEEDKLYINLDIEWIWRAKSGISKVNNQRIIGYVVNMQFGGCIWTTQNGMIILIIFIVLAFLIQILLQFNSIILNIKYFNSFRKKYIK